MKINSSGSLSILAVSIALIISGCALNTPANRDVVDIPADWRFSSGATASLDTDWWLAFNSDALNTLITEAQLQSPDLRIAQERVLQAELSLSNATAAFLPTANLSASSGESRTKPEGGDWNSSDSSRVSLGVSYEVDLWGKLRANRAASKAGYQASLYDLEASRLSLYSSLASGYFQWLSLNARLETAKKNLAIAERVYQIVQARYDNGVVTAADVARQRSTLLSQRASIAPLELQAQQTRSALAVLLGQTPQNFDLSFASLLAIEVPQMGTLIPSDLLLRRPDIAAAEAQLSAADANLVAARTALLPSFSLSGSVGQSTAMLLSLTGAGTSVSWTASLAQSIFQGGRLVNQIKVSESQQRVLLEQYRKTILTAFQEVDDAFLAVTTQAEQEALQQQVVTEAQKSLRITELRYKEGIDDMSSLLDAQRSLFAAEDSLVQQRLARLNTAITLYKVLGGGWQVE